MSRSSMRVVHLTSVHPRNDIRVFHKECRSLSAHGYDTTLVVADGQGDARVDGVAVVDVGSPRGRLDRLASTTRRVLARAITLDARIYHLHDPELLPVGLRLKQLGKTVVFDAHEDVPRQLLGKHYLHPWARRALSVAFERFERWACTRLDAIVTATPFIADKFLQVNPRTVSISNFPILGELDSNVPWADKANEVCYVGSIATIRGIKEMTQAMGLCQTDVRLNLVGGFAEAGLEDEVGAYAGWSRVTPWGVQDRAGVRRALQQSVAGLVTLHPVINYLDALPIKMFEYMAAGIPVVVSDFPLWAGIVNDAQCGVCVDPLDPAAIAAAIDELVTQPERARHMGENGRRAVEQKYNWGTEEQKLLALYESLTPRMPLATGT
jgi:glycosyltransferase involved in cell wall biosynthesis